MNSSDTVPDAIDLRPEFLVRGLPPRLQGKRPTCSVFTMTGAIEYAAAGQRGAGTPLSVEFLNWATNRARGREEDGGFFSDIWAGCAAHGVCPEADHPYQATFDAALQPGEPARKAAAQVRALGLTFHWIKEWDPETGLTPAHLAEITATLRRGWPVCGGFRWPKKPDWQEGVLQMCPPEEVFDGHSVLLVGCREDAQHPDGVFLLRDSGAHGPDGCLPVEYVRAYMNDAAWVEA